MSAKDKAKHIKTIRERGAAYKHSNIHRKSGRAAQDKEWKKILKRISVFL